MRQSRSGAARMHHSPPVRPRPRLPNDPPCPLAPENDTPVAVLKFDNSLSKRDLWDTIGVLAVVQTIPI